MPTLLRMPGVDANATDVVLSEWQVMEASDFGKTDAIATIETDKANVEIEAAEAGRVIKHLVSPGSTVAVGAPIALLGHPGETVEDVPGALRDLGYGDRPSGVAEQALEPTFDDATTPASKRIFATPLVRRLARDAGLALTDIRGTGVNGRIVKRDIVGVRTMQLAGAGPQPRQVGGTGRHEPDQRSSGYTDTPHSRMRKAIAARLVQSSQTAPHFYLRGSARADRLLALRSEINEASTVKISVNDFVVKAAGRAHTLVPGMNVIWRDNAVRSFDSVDIAVAVGSHQGLTTPVVRDVCGRGLAAIAADTRALAERARLGTLRQDEIEGGTLTISNLGMFGVEEFSAIINPPQAAILAVGAIRQEPVVHNGELTVGSVLRVTLSADHRPVDGVIAAQWMNALIDALENPVKILL